MHISNISLSQTDLAQGVNLAATLQSADTPSPSFVALHHRAGVLPDGMTTELAASGVALHCASSCKGIMQNDGTHDVGLFVITDPDGDYGTASAAFGDDANATAQAVTQEALSRAGRLGEAPDLIWVSFTPGCEEEAMMGIEAVVGSDVPIIGGSAADDTISGEWTVSDGHTVAGHGIVVSVLFCSTAIQFTYQSGYEPTSHTGVVTRSEGRRIVEIDGRPAADVYGTWTQESVPSANGASHPANILSDATLWPLGRKIGSLGGMPSYLLAHPSLSHPDGSIELFAEVETGEEITQMRGDKVVLAERAGRVAGFALKAGEVDINNVAGALMVYCGGCMLAVEDHLDTVYSGVDKALSQSPFLGTFTFGEQGPMHQAGNRHGNLMISCVIFTQEE